MISKKDFMLYMRLKIDVFKRKCTIDDAIAMLKVFNSCINTKTMPTKGSPCHEIILKILRDLKDVKHEKKA